MINLMPSEQKRQIRAGRINVILQRYIFLSIATAVFMFAAIGFAYYILTNIKHSADGLLANNHSQVQAVGNASTQLQSFQTSLQQASTSIASDINYTTVLSRMANVLPNGVVLGTMTISATTFGTPTTLDVLAKTNANVTDLQAKLKASPYFADVTLKSITSSSGDTTYPVSASFGLTINQVIEQ